MKKAIFIILTVLMVFSPALAQTGPQITFDAKTIDFGKFYEKDGKKVAQFHFTNTGDKLLVIARATTSCGCTVASFTKEPIKPGHKGVVTVVYDGRRRAPGRFQKSIRVETNDQSNITTLNIKGEMVE